jgi:hypothetical protein
VSAALRRFIRHAEIYGVEFVFEAAMVDLADDDLKVLARRLARLDPKWRFPKTFRNGRTGTSKPHSRAEKCHANGDSGSGVRDLYGHGRADALERLKRGSRVEVRPIGATRLPHASEGGA